MYNDVNRDYLDDIEEYTIEGWMPNHEYVTDRDYTRKVVTITKAMRDEVWAKFLA